MRERNTKALVGNYSGQVMRDLPFEQFREHVIMAFTFRESSEECYDQWLDAKEEWIHRTGKHPTWLRPAVALEETPYGDQVEDIVVDAIGNGIMLDVHWRHKGVSCWVFSFQGNKLIEYWPASQLCRLWLSSDSFDRDLCESPRNALSSAVAIKKIRFGA